MTDALDLIRKIHDAARPLVLAVTGGGSQAISELLTVPGASRTVLEAIVPYSAKALADWLGSPPEHYCSERTARATAMAAYQRARRLSPSDDAGAASPLLLGIACTASLASERPKRGAHRLHLALQTGQFTAVQSLELVKGRRSRAEEERLAATLIINLIAEACGLQERIASPLIAEEQVAVSRVEAPQTWQDLLAGKIACACARELPAPTGGSAPSPARRLIFAGAFNPRHEAHIRMAQFASRQLGLPVEFEISVFNVDKPPLDFVEMQNRAAQFGPAETLWFTCAATFVEKAAIFTPATFLVGADTMARIVEPKYYSSEAACQQAIDDLARLDCRFLVFGRQTAGRFAALSQLALPESLFKLCDEIPEQAFRLDISSTELRQAASSAD